MSDVLTDALNSTAGRLAGIVLKLLEKGPGNEELPKDIRQRLDMLAAALGKAGHLARVRLASDVSLLFEHAPTWTRQNIVPLFEWSSPEALDVWSARTYANYIGSPELIGLTKKPFLEIFARLDIPSDDIRRYSEWLVAIQLANQSKTAKYPISPTETRTALRRAGIRGLPNAAHRLATEMAAAKPEEKIMRWKKLIGPVFEGIWPLDLELQSPDSSFHLVHLLLATGAAFSDAADMIIPFIQSDNRRLHSMVFAIAEAPDEPYQSAPNKMLDLLVAVVTDATPGGVYSLNKALDRIRVVEPSVGNAPKFQRLAKYAAKL